MLSYFERRLDPFPATRHGPPPEGLFAFIYYYLRDARGWLGAQVAVSAAFGLVEVMLFAFLGSLVDMLADAERASFLAENAVTLGWMGGVLVILWPAMTVTACMIQFQVLSANLPMSARWRMHNQMLGQSMVFFSNEFAGRVSTKVMQTALAVREVAMKTLDVFTYAGVYFISLLALVAAADPLLLIPFVAWLVGYGVCIRYFVPRLADIAEKQSDARSVMTGRVVDSYTNIATVKLFSHSGREARYARDSMQEFLGTVHPQMRLVSFLHIAIDVLNGLLIFAVAALSIGLWLGELVSVGAIAAAVGLTLRINGMSQWIMWEVAALFENIGTIHDGKALLTRSIAVTDAPDARDLRVERGAVSFNAVHFTYGKETPVIDGLSLEVEPGQKIGLVGRSGAGKTTLCNLLLRFFDVDGGLITIDGQDISRVTQDSLRAQIGVVTQDTSLLHRTIRENIAYGRPEATDAEIWAAAKRANAVDFIEGLEDQKGRIGLDAHVGERGVKLSGGQRQRIAIARVFLKDAPILILDEATSALDSEVEAAIQENLFKLMQGKTVIAIAHRLSTIAALDRLVVMDRGRIIETGKHDELVAAGGLYAELWARQSGGFIAETVG